MSRWTDAFKDDGRINDISELLNQIKTIKLIKSDDILEFARVQKVHKYIIENLKKIDPELLPLKTIKDVTTNFDRIVEYLNYYINDEESVYLSDINTFYDTVIQSIAPYFPQGKTTAQAAAAAFKKYSETIEDALKQSIEENNTLIRSNDDFHQYLKTLRDQAEAYEINLSNVAKKYLTGTEDTPSLKAQFDKLLTDSNEWHDAIDKFHVKLFDVEDGEGSLATLTLSQIAAIQKAIENANEEIIILNKFYEKVIGIKDEDGNIEGGLEEDLNTRIKALDNYKSDKEIIHSNLEDEINNLLPGATSAGLATAFNNEKNKFSNLSIIYSFLFFISMIGLFFICAYSVTEKFNPESHTWEIISFTNYSELLSIVILRLSFILPIIFLALSFAYKRNQCVRLEQEYTHKEVIAKTVVSYRDQLEKIGETKDSELMKNLLAATIETVQFNPATTMTKKHKNDSSPINIDELKNYEKLKKYVKDVFNLT